MWMRSAAGAAALVAAAGVAAAVPPPPAEASSALGGSAPAASALRWKPCADRALRGFECASFVVPRDYARPEAGTFSLAVTRLRATGPASGRIGSLFFNPGGPGVPAVDLAPQVAAALPASVRARFDLVVWDPRGTGRSGYGIEGCTGGSFALPPIGPVDWDGVVTQMASSQAAANAECQAHHPDVVPYLSTTSTVRDLDGLRAAVGDAKLTYWGTSYGTRIGYVYALRYPTRVRAMLMSSSVAPSATWGEFAAMAGAAKDTAVGLMFELHPAAARDYRNAMRVLKAHSLRLPSGAPFTRWNVAAALQEVTSDSAFVPTAAFLRTAAIATNGTGVARRAALRRLEPFAALPPRIPIPGGATSFVGCLDYPQRLDAAEQRRLARQVRARAPLTGWFGSVALVYCEGMTVTPDPVPVEASNWTTPMLIIGATRDALTPYAWTADMARTFRNSRVVTVVSGTHTPVYAGSSCVDRYATAYLLRTARPRVDVACPSPLAVPRG